MKMLRLLSVLFALHVVSAFRPSAFQFLGFPDKRDALCSLGCKCPENGQTLMFFDCSRLGITQLPTFLRVEALVNRLSFQGNYIGSLHMSTFSRVDNIQELDLSLNQISDVDNFTFVPFKSLAMLRMSHNRLSEIHSGLLEGLSNLRVLEIGHNIIQHLSPESFQETPSLQELRLQYNPLFDLPENLFQHLPNLQKLDLQDTGLVRLPEGIFLPTNRLKWLSLSHNAFEVVPQEALSRATALESLDLSGNDFTILVEGAFHRLTNITVLYLNNLDQLSRIEKDALAGLSKLKLLSCSYNSKLNYIDEDAFGSTNSTIFNGKTPPREQLYLRQNGLRTLKSPLEMQTWSALSFVDLADNPWKCDCNLIWMIHLRKETQMNIICDSPPHLKGRSLYSLTPSELKCEKQWALATFILVISSMVAFGMIVLAGSAVVCSRTRVGLFVRAKQQFAYAKVVPKTETVDLEWDPSADS